MGIEDSRYWVDDNPDDKSTWGAYTWAIVDETQGGIIAYVHASNAGLILSALRTAANERVESDALTFEVHDDGTGTLSSPDGRRVEYAAEFPPSKPGTCEVNTRKGTKVES
jgi:hypothetical protein